MRRSTTKPRKRGTECCLNGFSLFSLPREYGLLLFLFLLGSGCSKSSPAPSTSTANTTNQSVTEESTSRLLEEGSIPESTELGHPIPQSHDENNGDILEAAGTTTPTEQTAVIESPTPAQIPNAASLVPPQVMLSDTHRKTCRIQVGETIPELAVTDLAGTQHQLKQLLSQQITLIVFWNQGSVAGVEQHYRLDVDVLDKFAANGVKVLAIHVGDKLGELKPATTHAGQRVDLMDSDRQLFAQFATTLLPRTYLVDAQGKVLWFDVEYSQGTQRSIEQAIRYYLTHPA